MNDMDMNEIRPKKDILETLKERPIVSDGAYILTLEKRGYVLAGAWTPEVILTNPEAVKELHREYLNVGSDVVQAFSFGSSGNRFQTHGVDTTVESVNRAACEIGTHIARANGAFLCGGITPTDLAYVDGELDVKAIELDVRDQVIPFIDYDVDYLLIEFFFHIEEMEIAINVCKQYKKPIAATMRIGPPGDTNNISAGECAVRMAKAGAEIVGVNCSFDPITSIETIKLMKEALDKEGLSPFLMMQPVGFHTQDVKCFKDGYHVTKEFPFCLEPRALTRFDVGETTRLAYEAGVRYFGGCCGYEPHHIREISYELRKERGFTFPGERYHKPYGEGLANARRFKDKPESITREYWVNTSKNFNTGR